MRNREKEMLDDEMYKILAKENKEYEKELKASPLSEYSTTQLKEELRRRKNKPNKNYRSDY